ncbi:hypothetical protein D3C75_1296430 [compost metagenome]
MSTELTLRASKARNFKVNAKRVSIGFGRQALEALLMLWLSLATATFGGRLDTSKI